MPDQTPAEVYEQAAHELAAEGWSMYVNDSRFRRAVDVAYAAGLAAATDSGEVERLADELAGARANADRWNERYQQACERLEKVSRDRDEARTQLHDFGADIGGTWATELGISDDDGWLPLTTGNYRATHQRRHWYGPVEPVTAETETDRG